MPKRKLHLDFETRSAIDLKKVGAYEYAKDPSTDALCLAYALDNDPFKLWIYGEPLPEDLKAAALDPEIEFVAHNANFEFYIWNFVCSRYGWPPLPISRLNCTMIRAFTMGLPGTLDGASKAVGLKAEKDLKGHRVMMQLCKPRRFEDDTPIYYEKSEYPEKYEELYRYCIQDSIVERELDKRLIEISPQERALWELDQKINTRGVYVDQKSAEFMLEIVGKEKKRLDKLMRDATDNQVASCNASLDLRRWLNSRNIKIPKEVDSFENVGINKRDEIYIHIDGVAKDIINDLLEFKLPAKVKNVLEIRKSGSKNSTAKINQMVRSASENDGRVRGCFQYYGAASTGRWAGRRIQLQNLPRPKLKQDEIEQIFNYFEHGHIDSVTKQISLLHCEPMLAITDMLRGLLCASPGHKLVAADWSAIEGRVLAWLANEISTLNVYRSHGKIYEHTAAQIYKCLIDDVTSDQRLIGKVANLALGYQGGKGAFQSMAKNYFLKISDEQADAIKEQWRDNNQAIKDYWYAVENAAIKAHQTPNHKFWVGPEGRQVCFMQKGSFLFCRLPSGRPICYPYPKLKQIIPPWEREKQQAAEERGETYEPKLKTALTYKGQVYGKWVTRVAYGGLITENITQATARDILAEALPKVERAGFPIVMHVHDEIVTEVPLNGPNDDALVEIMCDLPAWAKDLPVAAEGWTGQRFRK